VLDLGKGVRLKVLTPGRRSTVRLVEWYNFNALLPVGMGFDELETLRYGRAVGAVSAGWRNNFS